MVNKKHILDLQILEYVADNISVLAEQDGVWCRINLNALFKNISVPTKTSDLENDSGFIDENVVTNHNISETSHNDIRLLIKGLSDRLNAVANSDDTTLDQMSEIVAYIKANKSLIDSITTSKVNVADIIDNLETSVSNKPLSAKQGVLLKTLIDSIVVPSKLSQLEGDSTHRVVTDEEKQQWNNKSDFSGDYNDLENKPVVPNKTSQLENDSGFAYSDDLPTQSGTGTRSSASGYNCEASGENAFATGDRTRALEKNTFTAGFDTEASKTNACAIGRMNFASGEVSFASGNETTSSGYASYTEGYKTTASAHSSHAEGGVTVANQAYQHVQGKYNIVSTEDKQYASIVGNGNSNTLSNAHTLDWQGNAWYQGSMQTTGSDYAEFFEWLDGNPDNEDRIGLLVTLEGDKIKPANSGDEILGAISGTVGVLGDNYQCEWNGKYLTDVFGRVIYDMVEEFADISHTETDDAGNVTETIETVSLGFFKHPRINPDYDSNQSYINRADRPEWDTVGMLGKLFIRDDGTCQVNGYATVGENGIATASTERTSMRVLSREDETVIRVLLK